MKSVVLAREKYGIDIELNIYSIGHMTPFLIKQFGKYEYINFKGQVEREKLISAIARAHASIYIPYREDFGISCAESIGMGTLCIASSSGGLPEVWLDIYTNVFGKISEFPIVWDDILHSFPVSTRFLELQLPYLINNVPNFLES